MRRPFALCRLGAPHRGHVRLVQCMLALAPRVLVVVGSADVSGRVDVPLPWTRRRELLGELLAATQVAGEVVFAPLAELASDGWDERWCRYLLEAAETALGGPATDYVFGDDYRQEIFRNLGELTLHRVTRDASSGRGLLASIRAGEREDKYEFELGFYTDTDLRTIREASRDARGTRQETEDVGERVR